MKEHHPVIRVMTYNVHSCVGTDREMSHDRIAQVISEINPDIVSLQELDVGRARSGRIDQVHLIARALEMHFHFHPAIQIEEERYGDAILSRFPLKLVKAGSLPSLDERLRLERRGALWVTVEVAGRKINVFNTHFGLHRRERVAQARAVLGSEWMGHVDCRGPMILCGDFNAVPGSMAYRLFRRRLQEIQRCVNGPRQRTYPTRYPVLRLDHIFLSKEFAVRHVKVPRSPLTRVASDHYPLVAELELR